ncbi:hypothetical protein B566_EDAN011741 [Ephemera danica]|nr:hypothetical protein B566_EDAN011741 [Ephemera danica]
MKQRVKALTIYFAKHKVFQHRHLEPIGSAPPRLPPKSKLDAVVGVAMSSLVLACDAQAFPVPKFRQNHYTEPQTSLAPKVKDSEVELSKKRIASSNTATLLCAVQGYPSPTFRLLKITEPVTSIPPKMKDKEMSHVRKSVESRSTIPLICAVQGYPAPIFRTINERSSKAQGWSDNWG